MKPDKRYLLFAYDTYYPGGGLSDLKASFDTIDEAVEKARRNYYNRDFYSLYDRIDGVDIDLSLYGVERKETPPWV